MRYENARATQSVYAQKAEGVEPQHTALRKPKRGAGASVTVT